MIKYYLLSLIYIIPIIIIMIYIYRKDKIEKEPISLLLLLFISGIISAFIYLFINNFLIKWFPFLNNNYNELNMIELVFKSLIVIAFLEELIKWFSVYLITWKNKNFNHQFDPIIYCIMVSLGFALVESFIYSKFFINFGFITILIRSLISVPCQAIFATISGYYLGNAKYFKLNYGNSNMYIIYIIYSLLVPTAIHFIFDLLLIKNIKLHLYIFGLFIVFIYSIAFIIINKISKIRKTL